jgi:hypothetical protein
MVNPNVQHEHTKFQNTKNKENENTQKQVNELRDYLHKHQSEIKETKKERFVN